MRCPICKKLVKNLETPERLPLNINILYEIVESDPLLSQIDFDDESPEAIADKLCGPHNDRIMHFYCSNHRTIFCRECIQLEHTDEKCFVVDLYEIEKMRKLQSQNVAANKGQLAKRKDGASQSCVKDPPKREAKAVFAPVVHEYGNEETDEARTNEEDETQYLMRKQAQHEALLHQLKSGAGPIYFNEEAGDRTYDDEDEYE